MVQKYSFRYHSSSTHLQFQVGSMKMHERKPPHLVMFFFFLLCNVQKLKEATPPHESNLFSTVVPLHTGAPKLQLHSHCSVNLTSSLSPLHMLHSDDDVGARFWCPFSNCFLFHEEEEDDFVVMQKNTISRFRNHSVYFFKRQLSSCIALLHLCFFFFLKDFLILV